MSNDRLVHSNAFNFMSHLSGGVDPRTGLYTFSANLRSVSGNDQLGPEFDVVVRYSPLSLQDSGYGKGWTLRTSEFDFNRGRRIISLANGETFKADGRVGTTNQLTMSEKKIDTFHLYEDSDSQWRVVHRSGVVEVLEPKGTDKNARAVPTRIFSRQGHWLDLEYTTHAGFPMLSKITDMRDEVVFEVTPRGQGNRVTLAQPSDTGSTSYTLVLNGDSRVERIELPTENLASWRFSYGEQRGLYCLREVRTPTGGFEEITYGDGGHQFPIGSGLTPLPRVTRHVQHPGHGQPAIDTRYTYGADDHNFLGGNIRLDWADDGLDNLFRQVIEYDYATTETLWVDEKPVRSIVREFNKFHLLTSETTYLGDERNAAGTEVIGNQIKEVKTTYALRSGFFREQPNYCQLAHGIDTRWWLVNNPGNNFTLSEASTYDDYGNLLTQKAVSGVEDTYQWYSAKEPGFPGHDEGFVMYMKEKNQRPAAGHSGAAPVRTTHYTWQQLPTLTASQSQTGQTHWLAVDVETFTSGDNSNTTSHCFEQVADETVVAAVPLQHGRLKRQVISYPNPKKGATDEPDTLDTLTEHAYTYETLNWGVAKHAGPLVRGAMRVLQDHQLVTGFDATSKQIRTQQSLATGEVVLTRDDTDTEIMTVWDALLRVEREIVSPGKEEEAFRRYEYALCANDGEQATQTRFDVKDVMTVAYFDGVNRTVREERETRMLELPQAQYTPKAERSTKPAYRANYDSWGRLKDETEIDWLTKGDLDLTSHYRYDEWGEQLCVIGPDGVADFAHTDPIGDGTIGPIRREWRQQMFDEQGAELENGRKTGVTQTQLNRFELPVTLRRLVKEKPDDEQETVLKSETRTDYDGFGRKIKEVSGLGTAAQKQEETFSYDGFDRLLTHSLREGDVVHRAYAAHSDQDLPISIRVNDLLLGEQGFDGLGRKVLSITGGRRQILKYGPGESQPNEVITPMGAIHYSYRPHLTAEPTARTLAGTEASYVFDEHNARLKSCSEQGGEAFTRSYYTTGQVHKEERGEYAMEYVYSLQGRMEQYRDVLEQVQVNDYDAAGRLELTTLGELSSLFKYDELGRTLSYETLDNTPGSVNALKTELTYDDLEREVSRTFTFSQHPAQVLSQDYDEFDRITERTLLQGTTELRKETYKYDTRGRLTGYACSGELCPVDPYGKQITEQVFGFDALDNIRQVLTRFEGGENRAIYWFDNDDDPAQLSRITNTFTDLYPAEIQLAYDPNGNMTVDDAGRVLEYDALNRLRRVTDAENRQHDYGYDPMNVLTSTNGPA